MGVGYLTGQGGGGSNIKSLQHISSNLSSSLEIGTITISAVDITKTIIKPVFPPSTIARGSSISFKFLDSTTIQWQRDQSGTVQPIVIDVVEFNNVKSLQRSEISLSTSDVTLDVTIAAVDTSKTLVFSSLRSTATNNDALSFMYSVSLKNANAVNITRQPQSFIAYVNIEVIEFK